MLDFCRNRFRCIFAFTLAEVLITLGVIGVVAAMTLPILVQTYRNHVVETRLKKFYSIINQAIQRAEVDYGDRKDWYEDLQGATLDKNGNRVDGSSASERWFKKYFEPYLSVVKYSYSSTERGFYVYFPDGSVLANGGANTRTWTYYPVNPERCIEMDFDDKVGVCAFSFNYFPVIATTNGISGNASDYQKWKYVLNKGFEPYTFNWNGTKQGLYNGCKGNVVSGTAHAYCTKIIQDNGWKIPKDYPRKIRF